MGAGALPCCRTADLWHLPGSPGYVVWSQPGEPAADGDLDAGATGESATPARLTDVATITTYQSRTDADTGSQLPNNREFPARNLQSG